MRLKGLIASCCIHSRVMSFKYLLRIMGVVVLSLHRDSIGNNSLVL